MTHSPRHPMYNKQVVDLTNWFYERLKGETIEITREDHKRGIDTLSPEFNQLAKDAFDEWGNDRDYELSYNQLCIAFFGAAESADAIQFINDEDIPIEKNEVSREEYWEDTAHCDHCGYETLHGYYVSNHERDSSQNYRECRTCRWVLHDHGSSYEPPID